MGRVSQYKRNMQHALPASSNRGKVSRDCDELCPKCGRGMHTSDQKCRATNATCNNCHKIGYFAVVCRARSRKPSTRRKVVPLRDVGTYQRKLHRIIADVYCDKEKRRQAPRIKIVTTHPDGQRSIFWTPDSGAEATVMGWDVARASGIEQASLEAVAGEILYGAGQQQLTCLGKFTSNLELGDKEISTEVIVIDEVKGALLSWYNSIALGLLPPDFPTQIQTVEHAVCHSYQQESVMATAPLPQWRHSYEPSVTDIHKHAAANIHAFPQVFDAFVTLREMNGKAMRIELT